MRKERTLRSERTRDGEPSPAPTSVLGRCLGRVVQHCVARNERMRVCETLSLGGRRSLVLVECDGQRFLAGLSAGGVETLLPIDSTGLPGERTL